MLKQKFRRGNLVHVKQGSCQFNFEQGRDAVILGSYNDFYGGGDLFQYSVLFEDGNKCAWYHDEQLVLVDKGGEHLIEQIQEKELRLEAEHILTHADLNDLNSAEIVTLLRFLGFDYSISNNYFGLWERVLPVYQEIKESNSLEDIKVRYPDYDVEVVFNVFHNTAEISRERLGGGDKPKIERMASIPCSCGKGLKMYTDGEKLYCAYCGKEIKR